jgi:hypothetical protein
MHLQRIVLPSGHVIWTAYDGDAIVTEIREFVIYLEARHHAPSTVAHYARHVVRLGNYLAAMGKSFRESNLAKRPELARRPAPRSN